MKEIGGYFELEELIKNEYYKNLIALNTGRNALYYVLKARNIKKLYIPYYLCDSISNMLNRYKFNYDYYNINSDFTPFFSKKLSSDEYLYIVNYYGFLEEELVISLKEKYGRIILDNTHSFFQSPIKNIDTIYSCRKFFGVPDGAYLSTNVKLNEKIEIDESKDRMKHLLGRYEGKASDYYNDFQMNEKKLESLSMKYMSKLTHNILGAIDYDRVLEIRNKNYWYLKENLDKYNKLKTKNIVGPFAYPLYIENGIKIKKELAKKGIYIPTLWGNVLEEMPNSSIEYKYASNILPLPCDQRYNLEHMQFIVNEMSKYF
jgi:hypothetical protein